MRGLIASTVFATALFAQSSIPPSGGGGSSIVVAAPYLQLGANFYIPADNMYLATKPNFSGWTNMGVSSPSSVVAGTNGDSFVTITGVTDVWYAAPSGIASIETVHSHFGTVSSTTAYTGVYIYDTTNSRVYALVAAQLAAGGTTISTSTFTYAGSGNPAFSTSPFSMAAGQAIYHLKISVSGGVATFAVSLNGGATYSTLGTQAVGTIAKLGIYLDASSADFKSLVVN